MIAFLAVVTAVYFFDREKGGNLRQDRLEREAVIERKAAYIGDQLGNAVNQRIGAMASGELQFTPLEDSVSARTLAAALDTVTARYIGLTAMSAVYPSGRISRGAGALLGEAGMQPHVDTALGNAFKRAETTRQPAATAVVTAAQNVRRVVIFDPIESNEKLLGYLAAELDPALIYRNVIQQQEVADSLTSGNIPTYHAVYGPNRALISPPLAAPRGWPTTTRPIRVVDTEWLVEVAYQPVDPRFYRGQQIMRWAIGLLIAVFTALFFLFLRRT
ncbi:MAG TPA: hypothetical protein VEA63_01475, partial [Opitutus sp.]|nr:hypothetical protein [Opitutus sp.]